MPPLRRTQAVLYVVLLDDQQEDGHNTQGLALTRAAATLAQAYQDACVLASSCGVSHTPLLSVCRCMQVLDPEHKGRVPHEAFLRWWRSEPLGATTTGSSSSSKKQLHARPPTVA